MKNNYIPDDKEWKKIIDEAFDSDEIHIFSEHYNMQKRCMQRRIEMKKTNKNKRVTAIIAIAAATAVLVPTSVYGYGKINAKIEKTANYRNTAVINTEKNDDAQPVEIAGEGEFVYYEFGWIPEGYVQHEEGPDRWVSENDGLILGKFYVLPENGEFKIDLLRSEKCENYSKNGKTALINYSMDDVVFGEGKYKRNIFVSFDNSEYLLDIIISNDVSHEDLIKIIDNIKLIRTDEKLYGDYIPWLDTDNNNSSYVESKLTVDNDYEKQIGETISNSSVGYEYDVTLTDAVFTDSFEGIDTDSIGEKTDFSHLIDKNGNIIENTRSYVKRGDGVNTADEIVSEEKIPMHILKLNVTITNTADVENDICISPTMFIVEDGEPLFYWESRAEIPYYDSVLGGDSASEFFSLDVKTGTKGFKNSVILAPNESAEVEICYFVSDDVKDKVYVRFGYTPDSDCGIFFNVSQ